jgi:hypothetical protein
MGLLRGLLLHLLAVHEVLLLLVGLILLIVLLHWLVYWQLCLIIVLMLLLLLHVALVLLLVGRVGVLVGRHEGVRLLPVTTSTSTLTATKRAALARVHLVL